MSGRATKYGGSMTTCSRNLRNDSVAQAWTPRAATHAKAAAIQSTHATHAQGEANSPDGSILPPQMSSEKETRIDSASAALRRQANVAASIRRVSFCAVCDARRPQRPSARETARPRPAGLWSGRTRSGTQLRAAAEEALIVWQRAQFHRETTRGPISLLRVFWTQFHDFG